MPSDPRTLFKTYLIEKPERYQVSENRNAVALLQFLGARGAHATDLYRQFTKIPREEVDSALEQLKAAKLAASLPMQSDYLWYALPEGKAFLQHYNAAMEYSTFK